MSFDFFYVTGQCIYTCMSGKKEHFTVNRAWHLSGRTFRSYSKIKKIGKPSN
jgi:hypothetical protein